MKKIFTSLIVLIFLSQAAFAQIYAGVGARAAAMGGAGVAVVDDITSAYYNPAGLMRSNGHFEGLVGYGGAQQGLTDLINSISTAGDPVTYMQDNFDNEIDVSGAGSGIAGFAVNKIGVSLIPNLFLSANKPKSSAVGSLVAAGGGTLVITAGTTLPTSGLPFTSIDIGANVKYVASGTGSYAGYVFPGPTVISTTEVSYGTGFGFDVGARADVTLPITTLTIGVAWKDLLETINYTNKIKTQSWTGGTPSTLFELPETTSSATIPSTFVVGAAGTVPGIDTLITGDMEMVGGSGGTTNFRFGVEQPLALKFLVLRAGYASGEDLAMTTLGAGFHFGMNIDLAYAIDNNDSKNNSIFIDGSFAL